MNYRVRYSTEAATQDIPALDAPIAERVGAAVTSKLMVDPERFGKPLRHTLRGLRTLRVGDWRIVFSVERMDVLVLSIRHRSKGYRGVPLH